MDTDERGYMPMSPLSMLICVHPRLSCALAGGSDPAMKARVAEKSDNSMPPLAGDTSIDEFTAEIAERKDPGMKTRIAERRAWLKTG
jgi:hypothetical protein